MPQAATASCWSCQAALQSADIFCPSCNVIQPLQPMSHFARLGINPGYVVSESELERTYFDWQKKLHPDRFARKPEKERQYSLQQSMSINQAYETLKNPLKRAQYLLHLNGVEVNTERDTVKPEQPLLMEIMELREALMEAKDPAGIEAGVKNALTEGFARLAGLLAGKEWIKAAHETMRLHYLNKLQDDIRLHKAKAP